jgi:uncharacterized protein (UPF0261 family)
MIAKPIAIVGTLDTKGDQLEYLRDLISGRGHKTMVVDVGVLGDAPFKPDISGEKVAQAAGSSLEELLALHDESTAMEKMAEGASNVLEGLFAEDKVGGLVAVGGSLGTDLALTLMKALPFGVPKLILSTVAYSAIITPDMADTDIIMLPWTAGLWGLNNLSMQALEKAAGAISGAVEIYYGQKERSKKTVAVTSLGQTVCRYLGTIKPALEERGYDVAAFHVTGMSGRLLERAVANGAIDAVLDLAVGVELAGEITGGVASAGKNRLEQAGRVGIPQIVAPAAIEIFFWREGLPLPSRYKDRPRHRHNRLLTPMITSIEERAAVGRLIAEKLNRAKGPAAVVIPYKGYRHSHGLEAAVDFEDLDSFHKAIMTPEEGVDAFRRAIMENVNPNVKVVTLENSGINDREFTDTVVRLFDDMMKA